jgi:hypothetical protein
MAAVSKDTFCWTAGLEIGGVKQVGLTCHCHNEGERHKYTRLRTGVETGLYLHQRDVKLWAVVAMMGADKKHRR